MMRVLVVDDHAIVREGVKRLLADALDLDVAGEADTAQDALAAVASQRWDAVLLDISLPDRSGLEVLADLKQTHPRLPVLVFSIHPERQYAMRAFKAGAAGYLTKDSLAEELVIALRKVAQGGRYVSASLAEHLVFEVATESEQPLHTTLSDREYQVLCLLAASSTPTAIAARLGVSVKTISTYRSRIRHKMHLETTAELMHYAIEHHLTL